MLRRTFQLGLALCLVVAFADRGGRAFAETSPASASSGGVFELLDRLEDARLLFATTAYRIHTLDTLLRYGRDFGLETLDPSEALEWHHRALEVFEFLKSADDGGQGLAAWSDAPSVDAPTPEQMQWMETLVADAGYRALEFHDELETRIETAREEVLGAAREAGQAPVVERIDPVPWEEPQREIARRMGFTSAWFLWMNSLPDSEHAALDRQQGLDPQSLLSKARKMGVNAILPEFRGDKNAPAAAWPDVETTRGEWNFSRLDSNIADIAAHGMRTVVPVRSLDTVPPQWAVEEFGDDAQMGAHDDEEGWVPSSGVSLFEAGPRDAFLDYLTALCRHLQTHHRENIAAVALDPARMALAPEIGYSPAARKHFQRWLADRSQNDIAQLNTRWGTDYATFEEISLPAPRGEPPASSVSEDAGNAIAEAARWHDWLAWRKAWVAEHYQWQIDVIRKELPGIPIQAFAISANSHHAHSERPVASWPTIDWGGMVDLPSSAATSEPVHALIRAVGDGRFGGQEAEQNFGAMFGGAAYTAFLKDTLFTIARNGPEMIQRYFYSPGLYGYMDRQATWGGAYSYRLKMQEMHQLAPLIENTRMAPGEVAVLWSESSFDQDATRFSRYGVLGTAHALMSAKVHYDILVERDLDADSLESYPIVIVPEQRFLTDQTLELLRDYVRQGGTLYATGVPGMFDEHGVPRHEQGLHPLADCFGADLEEFTPIQAVAGTFLVPTRPDAVWDQRERGARWHARGHQFFPEEWTLENQLAATFAPRDGAEVLHSFADGSPAMVRNRYGDGTAVIFGYPFGHEFAFANTTEMSFGKLYPHYAHPVQMVNLQEWLGNFLREELGLQQEAQVPVSRMMRFTGTEASGPTMTYPSMSESLHDKREHTSAPNHSFNIGWREREGVPTRFLTVFNRDSAYAVGRGFLHYMASPTYGVIRINWNDVTAVFDVLNDVPVPFVAGDRSQRPDREGRYPDADQCISFEVVLPSYFGRVYAIATEGEALEIFDAPSRGDVLDSTLRERVAGWAAPHEWPEAIILDQSALREWLEDRMGKDAQSPTTIAYGDREYAESAARLATALRERGLEVRTTPLGLQHRSPNPDPYYPHRQHRFERPFPDIDIFIGNEHTNSNLADLTAAWQATRDANPRQLVSVNRHFPGGSRFVLQLTHPFRVNRERGPSFEEHAHRFSDHPRELIIGASRPEGALAGVEQILAIWSEPDIRNGHSDKE